MKIIQRRTEIKYFIRKKTETVVLIKMSQFDTLSDIKSETTYHYYNHTNLYEPDISFNAEPYLGRVYIDGTIFALIW